MSDDAQTLHPDVHVGSFLLYSISLDLKVEDAERREKDGVEHYGNGKQSYVVPVDSHRQPLQFPQCLSDCQDHKMPVRQFFSLFQLLFETDICAI